MTRGIARFFISSVVAFGLISAILFGVPFLQNIKEDQFAKFSLNTSFLNPSASSKLEALSIYDYEVIFLPTALNSQAIAPKQINIDSFANINDYTSYTSNSYTDYVLNKKETNVAKFGNVFFASIKEIMPFYKLEDKKDFLPKKDSVNISVVEVKSGEKIISENIKLKELSNLSSFFVPTEVFMNITPALNINIADNTSSSTVESSTAQLLKQALAETKIFQKINSGYYKIIISP